MKGYKEIDSKRAGKVILIKHKPNDIGIITRSSFDAKNHCLK